MSRVSSTIQVEVALGYEQAAARTRKISSAVRRAALLFLKDHTGERHVTVHEGDRIEFAGQS
ncbi:hypothetical protein [Nocardia sp. NPDC056000]|uniref:hypothetical protein n=1 Tax=Nocardia sp. NPDC056000 TaxID=3345674 RepID=UPI0035DB5A43